MKKISVLLFILATVTGVTYEVSYGAETGSTVKSITLPVISVELKDGVNKDKVESFCSICHSTDYIVMQPRFPREKWSAIVHKMIVVFGAPVNEERANEIIEYLSRAYGQGPQ